MGTKHVSVIGGGIAGLHVCSRFQRLGIDCTITRLDGGLRRRDFSFIAA